MSLTIEYIEDVEDVYDITVEDNHNFYANDILVHNCMEIMLPTKPFKSIKEGFSNVLVDVIDEDGFDELIKAYGFIPRNYEGIVVNEIISQEDISKSKNARFVMMEDKEHGELALCILSAINVGKVNTPKDIERVSKIAVRILDNLIDLQDYPVRPAEVSAKLRRTLGIGVTNLAYYFAKNDVRYSDGSALPLTHDLFENIQYYLIKASVDLAKERGPCEYFSHTNYARGLLPIDTYTKAVDELGNFKLKRDWDLLRQEIKDHGMRHSTLTAQMPVESSSLVQSPSTNGIEPIRKLTTVKRGLHVVAPEVDRLFGRYELMWEMNSNKGFIEVAAVMQKFIDQAISTNTRYDPKKFKDEKIPTKTLLKDISYAYKLGLKTLYYQYTNDEDDKQKHDKEINNEPLPSSNRQVDDDECESCVV